MTKGRWCWCTYRRAGEGMDARNGGASGARLVWRGVAPLNAHREGAPQQVRQAGDLERALCAGSDSANPWLWPAQSRRRTAEAVCCAPCAVRRVLCAVCCGLWTVDCVLRPGRHAACPWPPRVPGDVEGRRGAQRLASRLSNLWMAPWWFRAEDPPTPCNARLFPPGSRSPTDAWHPPKPHRRRTVPARRNPPTAPPRVRLLVTTRHRT